MRLLATFCLALPLSIWAQRADVIVKKNLTQVSFGSCSKQNKVDDQLWEEVNFMKSDLWIWLGDNIYSDTEDMAEMRANYAMQKSHPGYQQLLAASDVIGIWDDHDFGVNDGGKEYPMKKESKEELFRFLDVPESHPARQREGAYQSYLYEGLQSNVKVILLDARYFRDPLKKDDRNWNIPDSTGQILGDDQWQWLEAQLGDKEADLILLGSGIQVLPIEHRFEKWSNFPVERQRLFKLIASTVDVPLLILSGDRHISEVSKIDIEGYRYPLYEFTSSSLTNPWSTPAEEANKYRQKEIIFPTNFAHLDLVLTSGTSTTRYELELNYIGREQEVLQTHYIRYQRQD